MRSQPAPATLAPAHAGRRRFGWPRLDGASILLAAAVLLVGWILLVPLGFLVLFSFRGGTILRPGALTLANYQAALSQPVFLSAIGNTVIVAVAATLITATVATLLAWLIERRKATLSV